MKIAVLGCGNMMSAFVVAMAHFDKNIKFFTYTPSFNRAKILADKIRGVAVESLSELPDCEYYFIGCKPQQVAELAKNISIADKKIVSILAGTSLERLAKLFNSQKLLRVMPNTPSLIGEGVGLYCAHKSFLGTDLKFIIDKLKATGSMIHCQNEKQLGELTAITGSGPALVFYFIQAMYDKSITLGLDKSEAKKALVDLFKGSALLLDHSPELSFTEQIEKVTSKGGVTAEILNSFESDQLNSIISKAIDSGIRRNEELSKL